MAHISLEAQFKKYLKDIGVSGGKSGGKAINDILMSEAKKLLDILQEELDEIYARETTNKYGKPWYERTNDLRNSLDKSLVIDPTTNTIAIKFIPELAWHDSWITKKRDPNYNHEVYVPMAVDEGFTILKSNGKQYDGQHFIDRAVERFNRIKKSGTTVTVERPDNWW